MGSKILVVEDEKKVSSFIKRGLEEEKYEVETAADGEEGLKLAGEGAFDLIVLDWMLPKKDGLTVLRELREQRNATPVLMLTAKDTVEDIVAGLETGSDDYLTKPFAFAELLARVKALLRRFFDSLSEEQQGKIVGGLSAIQIAALTELYKAVTEEPEGGAAATAPSSQ